MSAWTRRRVLGTGLLGLAGLGLPLRLARAATERVLVIYWAKGGWDTTFVFDPHPESDLIEGDPSAEVEEISGLSFAHSSSRPEVRRFFEQWAGESCIVNGISVGSISHATCTQVMLTGTRLPRSPDLPTILGAELAGDHALPSVLLSGPRYPGELGATSVALNGTLTGTASGVLPADRTYDPEQEALLRAYLAEEAAARAGERVQMDHYARGLASLDALEEAASALEIPEAAGFEERFAAGIQGLSRGLCKVVMIEGTVPTLAQWDSHNGNDDLQDRCFEHAFGELSHVMERLSEADAPGGGKLADQAMVLAMSEMGRTPVHNTQNGKDHWPYTSLLALGQGVRGGRVVGLTDELLVGQPVDLDSGEADEGGQVVLPAHVMAGVLQAFGVDTSVHLPDVAPLSAAFTAE